MLRFSIAWIVLKFNNNGVEHNINFRIDQILLGWVVPPNRKNLINLIDLPQRYFDFMFFDGFWRFSGIAMKLGGDFLKSALGEGGPNTFHDFQNQNPKFVCMYKVSFTFNLRRRLVSISLKLGRTVVPMNNWSCMVFSPIRSYEGGWRCTNSRIFREWKPDYQFLWNSIGR